MKTTLLSVLLWGIATVAQAQVGDLQVAYQLRGYFFAGTAVEDTRALGGFASSRNLPRPLPPTVVPAQQGLFVWVATDTPARFDKKYRGHRVYLGNRTDTLTAFEASDSRLSIVTEAFYQDRWQPIEYLPSSWCGNSYHRVFLKPDQYWSFVMPAYNGPIPVSLRLKVQVDQHTVLYSNEFSGSVTPEQFTTKEGHTPLDIMDPYVD
ncbi:hypothetical protein SAMN05421823_102645 [Catalinimonas alkaloidigena]|uniref:GLPGLI family protein n=1 Tax=Catalinimonas alkaloidigena TaxID=1075417 RepID=A0A1G9BKI7_9BACT|nr:hypothetical protein [Catalinimonas alkaloidigena]SDK40039.1 hypothetical protein SAMN05421823_102645 [Catalinimonas alkaloidigena]